MKYILAFFVIFMPILLHAECKPETDKTETINPELLSINIENASPEIPEAGVAVRLEMPSNYQYAALSSVLIRKRLPKKQQYAFQIPLHFEPGENGKTTAWFIIAKEEISYIEVKATYACEGFHYQRFKIERKLGKHNKSLKVAP